jgi:hypothetical protein
VSLEHLLVVRYGSRIRWTVAPKGRGSDHTWDAGPVADWCETSSDTRLDTANRAVAAEYARTTASRSQGPQTDRQSRIDRQRWAHALGPCSRPDHHLPTP